MTTALGVLILVCALFLIISVLLQSSKNHRMSGVVSGGADTFFGKQKGKTIDAKLSKATAVISVVFCALILALYFVTAKESKPVVDEGTPEIPVVDEGIITDEIEIVGEEVPAEENADVTEKAPAAEEEAEAPAEETATEAEAEPEAEQAPTEEAEAEVTEEDAVTEPDEAADAE